MDYFVFVLRRDTRIAMRKLLRLRSGKQPLDLRHISWCERVHHCGNSGGDHVEEDAVRFVFSFSVFGGLN